MELSTHYRDGYQINIEAGDIVIFDSVPPLTFDLADHGLSLGGSRWDCSFTYRFVDNRLYLVRIEGEFKRPTELFGVVPTAPYPNKKLFVYFFDGVAVDYSGTFIIGKGFDKRFWRDDGMPIPFSPEVYKQKGYMKIEKGQVVEKALK